MRFWGYTDQEDSAHMYTNNANGLIIIARG